MQFTPNPKQGTLTDGFVVARDTVLRSNVGKTEQTPCEYRTAHEVTLWPLEITQVTHSAYVSDLGDLKVASRRPVKASLKIRLKTANGLPFEKLSLEGFQAGLSWITILRKRDHFRKAFDDFQPEKIARYNAKKVHALMNDAGIVRNRAKIEGTIASAKSYLKIMEESPGFSKFLWDFVDGKPKVNTFKTTASVPASTPVSIKLSKELSLRGFKFVGPTIVYAFMQATGMVNDHLVTCFCHESCAGKRRTLRLKVK